MPATWDAPTYRELMAVILKLGRVEVSEADIEAIARVIRPDYIPDEVERRIKHISADLDASKRQTSIEEYFAPSVYGGKDSEEGKVAKAETAVRKTDVMKREPTKSTLSVKGGFREIDTTGTDDEEEDVGSGVGKWVKVKIPDDGDDGDDDDYDFIGEDDVNDDDWEGGEEDDF